MISEYPLPYHNDYFMGMLTLLEGGFLGAMILISPPPNFFGTLGTPQQKHLFGPPAAK
jgi:hypothetical protein